MQIITFVLSIIDKFRQMAKGIKTGGRTKGTPNSTTAETKELLQTIVSNEMETITELLEQLTPKERIDAIIKLLPYIVPKQNEITVDAIIDKPRTVISWGNQIIEI